MALKYSCFISYCHGEHDLIKDFIDKLQKVLHAELEGRLGRQVYQVYVDKDRLKEGYKYNDALAKAICESVCMIVVYQPEYENHTYCKREYAAMELLEKKRKTVIPELNERGLIIPIILRDKRGGISPKIKNHTQYYDCSKLCLASVKKLTYNHGFTKKIREISDYIYEIYEMISNHKKLEQESSNFNECDSFKLPTEAEIEPWGNPDSTIPPFPGRSA